jgi:NADH:ubiquinone oxidoreductase subunit H
LARRRALQPRPPRGRRRVRCGRLRALARGRLYRARVVTHLAKLVYFGGLATDGWEGLDWPIFALSIAMAMLGTSLARAILERLTDAQFRVWTQRIIMAIGLVYVVMGVRAAFAG